MLLSHIIHLQLTVYASLYTIFWQAYLALPFKIFCKTFDSIENDFLLRSDANAEVMIVSVAFHR